MNMATTSRLAMWGLFALVLMYFGSVGGVESLREVPIFCLGWLVILLGMLTANPRWITARGSMFIISLLVIRPMQLLQRSGNDKR